MSELAPKRFCADNANSHNYLWLSKINELQQDLHSGLAELRAVKDAVGTLTAFLEQATRVDAEISKKIDEYFPIKSDEDLSEMDEKITEGNAGQFIKHMALLLNQSKISRSIRNIFSEEILLNYNLDGYQNKKKLKSFNHFLPALLNAIGQVEPSEPEEKTLKKAMRCVKNLNSSKKKALKSSKTIVNKTTNVKPEKSLKIYEYSFIKSSEGLPETDGQIAEEIENYFPIKSDEELSVMDDKINQENGLTFITHMILLLSQGRMSRSIRKIFSDEIILNYNLDGALVAIGQVVPSEPVEKALTKAMRCVKNLHAAKKMAVKFPKSQKTMETSIRTKKSKCSLNKVLTNSLTEVGLN
nr:uncharacterized protein LOC108054872 isoform X2 [Drosophila takahashii]